MRRSLARVLWVGLLAGACAERPAAPAALALDSAVGTLELEDLEGRRVAVPAADGAATVVWFWSASCACVKECEERIGALRRATAERGVRFLAVDANDGDDPAAIRERLAEAGSTYAVLRDRGARVARRLGVRASATVVVLDREGRLRYRGAPDDDLYAPRVAYAGPAVEAVLAGRAPDPVETESYGCVFPVPDA